MLDPTDWTVEDLAMVNSVESLVTNLPKLLAESIQKVAGKSRILSLKQEFGEQNESHHAAVEYLKAHCVRLLED